MWVGFFCRRVKSLDVSLLETESGVNKFDPISRIDGESIAAFEVRFILNLTDEVVHYDSHSTLPHLQ